MSEPSQITEVVFIDAGVAARSGGLAGSLQSPGRSVVVLDPLLDGLQQMASVLGNHQSLGAIHVISHGEAGRLWLGGKSFTSSDLEARASDWAQVGAALQAGGDLLLYGCDIGAGDVGAQFLADLARLTGADVAASVDATGSLALGGDHELEAATGSIEAEALGLDALEGLLDPAGPVLSNLDGELTFEEGAGAVVIDTNLAVTGSNSYGGGYIEFRMDTSHAGDQFVLGSDPDVNANGAISVVNGTVYLGNGTSRDVIGSIDPQYNGQNGNPLRINFTAPFTDPSFEEPTLGWTVGQQMVKLGETIIAGWPSPTDDSHPPLSGGDGDAPTSAYYYSSVVSDDKTDGQYALRLWSSMTTANGYDVVHGPYAYSDVFEAARDDVIYFDWRALAGQDAYDVFAYILNVDNGQTQIILNETGPDQSGNTPWTTASVTIPATGNWRFVFVAGTYDFTGGKAAGGSLYIDNVRVFGSKVKDSVVTQVAQQVTYQNTSLDSPPERTLTIEVSDAQGQTGSASTTLKVMQANNAPSFTGAGTLAAVDEDTADPEGASVASLFNTLFSDPDAAVDPKDTLGGIVVVANQAHPVNEGVWEYSTDGGTSWHAVGTVSGVNGLVLSADSLLRFRPVADFNGTPGSLQVHAIDSTHADANGSFTSGTDRVYLDVSIGGGHSAVSAGAVALNTSITPVNDAPIARPDEVVAIEDGPEVHGNALANDTDPDLGDQIRVTTTGSQQGRYGTLVLDQDGTFVYTLNHLHPAVQALSSAETTLTETFTYEIRDGAGLSSSSSITVVVQGTNDAPVVNAPLGRMDVAVGQAFTWQPPAGSVFDIDGSQYALRYVATLEDGRPLPAWLNFDPATGALSGVPDAGSMGTLSVRIAVMDGEGGWTAFDPMTIVVSSPAVWLTPAEVEVPETRRFVVRVQAEDPDGETLTYALAGGADAARFKIDPATGELSFRVAPDFELPRDADGDNRYEVIVEATNGRGIKVQQTQWITVKDLVEDEDDLDGDGTPDSEERGRDTDGDGIDDELDEDDDGDGVDSLEESQVPSFVEGGAQGDGNGDGVPDTLQSHVSSRRIGEGLYATLVAEADEDGQAPVVGNFQMTSSDGMPGAFSGGFEAISFSVLTNQPGGMQSFSLFLPGMTAVQGLWMRGMDGLWHDVGATVEQVAGGWRFSFQLQDGGLLDMDGLANGQVVTGPVMAARAGLIPVHRFSNEGQQLLFQTASLPERDALVEWGAADGWRYDGIEFVTPEAPVGATVWRFFHAQTGDHFYTATPEERDVLLAHDFGYAYEGPSFQVYEQQVEGSIAMHRYFNAETADHYYTIHAEEHVDLIGSGYAYEGVLGYVLA